MEVTVHAGDMDAALRELKRKMLRDGIFRTLKDRQEPSAAIRKRNKKRKALRRLKKQKVRQDR